MTKYEFQWFEKEDRRRRYRASVGRDGKLRIGKCLRAALPPSIRLGFDVKRKVLAMADGRGAGIDVPKYGVLSAQALSARITSTGLRLPVSFLLERDEATGLFLGRVLPRRRRMDGSGRREYDTEQLLVLYQHVVDQAVAGMARTTPREERQATAREAFSAAVGEYCPGCGDLERYLEERVREKLRAENRRYFPLYTQRSLDQPLGRAGEEDGFCLYDTAEASDAGGIDRAEARIAEEQFGDTLTPPERTLLRMLREGYSQAEIARTLRRTETQVAALAREIGRKRRKFYGGE